MLTGGVSGAGGSINLTTGIFSGFGILSAQGGATQAWQGHNPAGGLILVTASTSTFTGSFAVTGGIGVPAVGPGTALLVTPARAATLVAGTYSLRFGDHFAAFALRPATTLSIEGRATITAPMSIGPGATVILNSPASLEAVTIDQVDGTLKVMADVTNSSPLQVRGQLVVDRQFTVPSLHAVAGATISHSPQVTTMHLIATGAMTLATGALINAQGAGLSGGTTIDPITLTVVSGAGAWNGGSHAGRGGKTATGTQPATYDDPNAPRFGGGGGGGNTVPGPAGGGVIRLSAAVLTVDGVVLADGAGTFGYTIGSGAGGSIVLTAGTLRGIGQILARGYTGGNPVSGGGGGGIINISSETNAFTGTKSVIGGAGDGPGGNGVIVEKALNATPLIVSTPPSAVTRVGQSFTYTPVATGTKPLTWSLPTAPTGATVDSATGVVNWLPQAEGVAAFDLAVANASGANHQAFAVTAMNPPAVTSTASQAGVVGQPYHYDADDTLSASGSAPLTWSLQLGPAGLTVDAASGQVVWVPQVGGTHLACVEVQNDVGKASQCFAVAVTGVGQTSPSDGGVEAPRVTSTPGTVALWGAPYRYAPSRAPTVEGTGPFDFTLAPVLGIALPPSLGVDASTGELNWTPTSDEAGAHPVELRVSGPGGTAAQQFAIVVECSEAKKTSVQCGCSMPGSSLLLTLVAVVWGRRRRACHAP